MATTFQRARETRRASAIQASWGSSVPSSILVSSFPSVFESSTKTSACGGPDDPLPGISIE